MNLTPLEGSERSTVKTLIKVARNGMETFYKIYLMKGRGA